MGLVCLVQEPKWFWRKVQGCVFVLIGFGGRWFGMISSEQRATRFFFRITCPFWRRWGAPGQIGRSFEASLLGSPWHAPSLHLSSRFRATCRKITLDLFDSPGIKIAEEYAMYIGIRWYHQYVLHICFSNAYPKKRYLLATWLSRWI